MGIRFGKWRDICTSKDIWELIFCQYKVFLKFKSPILFLRDTLEVFNEIKLTFPFMFKLAFDLKTREPQTILTLYIINTNKFICNAIRNESHFLDLIWISSLKDYVAYIFFVFEVFNKCIFLPL